MTTNSADLAIYGGTFDPIHYGHLKTAAELVSVFPFNPLYFLPCKQHVLKDKAKASAEQRVAMLNLALQAYPQFKVELCEINREGPSYMVDTLKLIWAREKPHSLTLIIGMDAFQDLCRWHQWQSLIDLANLLILKRPGYSIDKLDKPLQGLLDKHLITDPQQLCRQARGQILFFDAGQYPISATAIRRSLAQGVTVDTYLPEAVAHYIRRENIYS